MGTGKKIFFWKLLFEFTLCVSVMLKWPQILSCPRPHSLLSLQTISLFYRFQTFSFIKPSSCGSHTWSFIRLPLRVKEPVIHSIGPVSRSAVVAYSRMVNLLDQPRRERGGGGRKDGGEKMCSEAELISLMIRWPIIITSLLFSFYFLGFT